MVASRLKKQFLTVGGFRAASLVSLIVFLSVIHHSSRTDKYCSVGLLRRCKVSSFQWTEKEADVCYARYSVPLVQNTS